MAEVVYNVIDAFQSTPSVGRATLFPCCKTCNSYISIHTLRGEGDNYCLNGGEYDNISIHTLRGEGDLFKLFLRQLLQAVFQSTPSVGRATDFGR